LNSFLHRLGFTSQGEEICRRGNGTRIGRRRRKTGAVFAPTAAAILGLMLIALPCFGLTIGDLSLSRRYFVRQIEVAGEHSVPESDVLSVMNTRERPAYQFWKPRPEFDPRTFTDDLHHIKRLYEARGYYRARIDYNLELDKDAVTVHLRIDEGKPVRVAELSTVYESRPSAQDLDPSFALPLKTGDRFDQEEYEAGERNLSRLYTTHAYARARVRRHATVDVQSLAARVRYEVDPGARFVFGHSRIVGTRRVDPGLIRRALTYRRGEPFNSQKLAESREALVGLNLFSSVNVEPQASSSESKAVPILITVIEGPKHALNGGIGYNTQTQFNAMIGWTDYNFVGGGRQFSLTGTYSDVANVFDAKLLQPYFLSSRSSLTLEASQQQQIYQTYTGNITGFDPHFDYRPARNLTLSLGWRLEYLKFNDVNASTIAAIGGFRRAGILSGPMAGLSFDDTDNHFNPRRGEAFWLFANVSDRTFGADYSYWHLLAEARKYQLLGWRTVLATRLKIGLSDKLGSIADVPLSERFYSGGEGSVRGYGLRRIGPLSASNDPLGGLSLIEGSIELRRPLFWKLNGVIFFDCGQVSTKAYDLRVDALQCGYGPALGMDTPVGPVTVYVGFPTQRPRGDSAWQFYFSIGQYF